MTKKSGYGGNFTYPVRPHLFNKMDTADIGLYSDSLISDAVESRVLILKETGLLLPRLNTSVNLLTPSDGERKSLRLIVNPICPCDACEYNFEIQVSEHSSSFNTGYINPPAGAGFYGGRIPKIDPCVNGLLSDANIEFMQNTILEQIVGYGAPGMKDNIISAKKYYIIEDTDTVDTSGVILTKSDGATVSFNTVTTFGAGEFGKQFNASASVNTEFIAFRIAENRYLIVSYGEGVKFSVAAGADTSVIEKGLLVTAKSAKVQFDIKAVANTFLVKDGVNLVRLDNVLVSGKKIKMHVDGGALLEATTHATTISTVVSNINTALGGVGFAQHSTGAGTIGSVFIALGLQYGKLSLRVDPGVSINYQLASNASFGTLTPEQVYRTFMDIRKFGGSAYSGFRETPIKDEHYVKLEFFNEISHPALHGASHGLTYKALSDIYILKSIWDSETSVFDSGDFMKESSDAGFTADTGLKALFVHWKGSAF